MKDEKIVFVGGKPFMNYVTAVVMQFTTSGANNVIIRSRGKFINRAVDVAEMVRSKFLTDSIKIGEVVIAAEDFKNREGRPIRVSTIDIHLNRLNGVKATPTNFELRPKKTEVKEEVKEEPVVEETPAETVEETPAETVEETPAEETAKEEPAVKETPKDEVPTETVEETSVEVAQPEVKEEPVLEETPAEEPVKEEAPVEPVAEEPKVEETPTETEQTNLTLESSN
jgi:DNA-binding protein